MFLITYLFECVDYKILFNIEAPPGKKHGEKVLLNDVTIPIGECAAKYSFKVNLYIKHGETTFYDRNKLGDPNNLFRDLPGISNISIFILDMGVSYRCCKLVVVETVGSRVSSLSILGH